jgi:hypothetical protein
MAFGIHEKSKKYFEVEPIGIALDREDHSASFLLSPTPTLKKKR